MLAYIDECIALECYNMLAMVWTSANSLTPITLDLLFCDCRPSELV